MRWLGLRFGLVVVALAGCSEDWPPALVGRYRVTSTQTCGGADTFDLWPHANGTISLPGIYVSLVDAGSGVYAGEYGTCTPSQVPHLLYQAVRVTRTSDTAVRVETAVADQLPQQECSETAALALAPTATVCAIDGELTEAAPRIGSLSPQAISRSDCTQSLQIDGTGFAPDVRVGYEMTGIAAYPATVNCPSPWTDTDEMGVCNLVVERRSSGRIVAHLDANSWSPYDCFVAGTLQLVVENPPQDTFGGVRSGMEAYVPLQLTN